MKSCKKRPAIVVALKEKDEDFFENTDDEDEEENVRGIYTTLNFNNIVPFDSYICWQFLFIAFAYLLTF